MIEAKIIADSLHPNKKDRITTMQVTFPRFILAELNTHRMFSRNSASSRAIPFEKMVKSVEENPFIPIAWQKDHKGMQGSEYLNSEFELNAVKNKWLEARDSAIEVAKNMNYNGVTKQLCNRLLEPFMWHTVLITATEWDNFFELRCPQYYGVYKSQKDLFNNRDVEKRRKCISEIPNEGQSEIHMMALAEAMWDAKNESIPKQLEEGQWHIPMGIDIYNNNWCNIQDEKFLLFLEKKLKVHGSSLEDKIIQEFNIKVATANCARISYTTVGEESKKPNYENDIKLHDKLLKSSHFSPFEHCAKAMDKDEFNTYAIFTSKGFDKGWCKNYYGFIQYRELID